MSWRNDIDHADAADGRRQLRKRGTAAAVALLFVVLAWFAPTTAEALPSFAVQTGQPCAACHIGAFGPQLKQVGRDFKLFGYASTDTKNHFPPLAITAQSSFTHTEAGQPGGAAPHFGDNNNPAFDEVNLYYAGRILPDFGAFVQLRYDNIARNIDWDATDIRRAGETTVVGNDLVWGLNFNNDPTVEDLWNSTPSWGFPYSSSPLAPTPAAHTVIDLGLQHQVAGAGAYAMWNDWVYLDLTGYKGIGRKTREFLGEGPVLGSDSTDEFVPYWRLAVQHEFAEGQHYFEFGTYGLAARIFPGSNKTAGRDHVYDTALDANYQFIVNPRLATSDALSAHATFIHERQLLGADEVLAGTNGSDSLNTFRADLSYSIDATYTPSIQYFRTYGSTDGALYSTANGSPDSAGFLAEIAYVPWGKPDSPVRWANARLALQYVAYSKFDGTTAHASDNNTLFLNLWIALGVPN